MDDLDFYIGDEAFGATGYAVKVCNIYTKRKHSKTLYLVSSTSWFSGGLGFDGEISGTVHF